MWLSCLCGGHADHNSLKDPLIGRKPGKSEENYKSQILTQCTPDIWLRSCISRHWIYRGRILDPIFLPNYFTNFCRRGAQERDTFPEITPWIQFKGDKFFAKSVHRDNICSRSQETIFHEIDSSLPVNAGWNTCCAMVVSHTRRSIDTSIVSSVAVNYRYSWYKTFDR